MCNSEAWHVSVIPNSTIYEFFTNFLRLKTKEGLFLRLFFALNCPHWKFLAQSFNVTDYDFFILKYRRRQAFRKSPRRSGRGFFHSAAGGAPDAGGGSYM